MADAQVLYKGTHSGTAGPASYTVITIDGTDIENVDQSYGAVVELYAVTYSTSSPYWSSASNVCHVHRVAGNVTVVNGTAVTLGSTLTDLSLTASTTDILVEITRTSTATTTDTMVWAVVRAYKP